MEKMRSSVKLNHQEIGKKHNWIHLKVWIDGIWFQLLTINATLFLEELRMNFDRNVDRSF